MSAHKPVSEQDFAIDVEIPGKKGSQFRIDRDRVAYMGSSLSLIEIDALKFGIKDKSGGLINLGRTYEIAVKDEKGQKIQLEFVAKSKSEIQLADATYSRIIDSMWYAIMSDLVYYMYDDILDEESFMIGDLEVDIKGVNYAHPKDFFFIPWQELKYEDRTTHLHIWSETMKKHQLDLNYRTVWNAYIFKCALEQAVSDGAIDGFNPHQE